LKLIPGAYKADLFRAVYLYYEGGLYFDCKNILYTPFHFFISKEKSLCQDLTKGLYNGNLFFSKSYNECLKLYLLKILDNIKYDSYNKNHLSVTGGHLFSNYIDEDSDEDVCLKNKYENDEWINNPTEFNKTDKWQYSFVVEIKTGKIILKTSYYKYYNDETTRIDYVDLYKKKEIYLPIVITDEIDNILDT
jgi:mannosyltransferase OCH1-like enzyme